MIQTLDRLHRRIMAQLAPGRVKLVDDSKAEVQTMQVDLGPIGPDGSRGIRDKTPRVAEYGLASHPPKDAHVVVLTLGGDRTDAVVIATNHVAYRLKDLIEGEAALYNGVRGTRLLLGDGEIILEANGQNVTVQNAPVVTVKASTKVRLETPRLEVTGDIVDNCDSQSTSVKDLRDAYDAHKHSGGTISGNTGTTDHTV